MPPALAALASALLAKAPARTRAPPPAASSATAVPVTAALALFLVSYQPPQKRRKRRSSQSRERRNSQTRLSASESKSFGEEVERGSSLTPQLTSVGGDVDEALRNESSSAYSEDLAEVSELRASGKRDILVVTTAAIPWMTGTAVNPLLRVMYLAKDGHRATLCVPWLPDLSEQRSLFPAGITFQSREAQTETIMAWAHAELPGVKFDVMYYDGVYSSAFGSIMPLGDLTAMLVESDVVKDVCVLEEPEHLTWHQLGPPWTRVFRFVVGVIHTNYLAYIEKHGFFGPQYASAFSFLNSWVCRSYCHRVVKLSDALQNFPHSVTSNIHGVRMKFLRIGLARSASISARTASFPRGMYFMGKVLWSKGYRELVDLMEDHYYRAGEALPIDFFGAGPDSHELEAAIRSSPALSQVDFQAGIADHTSARLQGYKIYVNASRSDVVCTATAEALAMGKTVVLLDHPSNEFFAAFPNCITFRTPETFSDAIVEAMEREPYPLTKTDAYHLTWEAATERFYDAVRVPMSESKPSTVDGVLANTHKVLSQLVTQPAVTIRRAKSADRANGVT